MTLHTSLRVGGDASGAKTALKETEAGLKKVEASAKEAGDALGKSTRAQGGTTTATEKARQTTEKFGQAQRTAAGSTANLTSQLNDIGVMLAAGQNPLQLALQQGTQINQVFDQLGGGPQALRAIGAAFMQMISPVNLATIGIIGFGAAGVQALMSLRGETQTLEDRIDALSEAVDAYAGYSATAKMSTSELTEEFGSAGEAAAGVASILANYGRIDAIEKLDAAVNDITTSFGGLSREQMVVLDTSRGIWASLLDKSPIAMVSEIENTFLTLREELELTDVQASAVVRGLEAIAMADGIDAQTDAVVAFDEMLTSAFGTIKAIPPELREMAKQSALVAFEAARIAGAQQRAADASRDRAEAELTALGQTTALMREELRLGADTLAFQQAKADADLAAYAARVRERDISEDLQDQLIAAYAVQTDLAVQSWENERALSAGEAAARGLARALDAAAGFSTDLGGQISVLNAEIAALQSGANAAIARQIETDRVRAAGIRDAAIAAGAELDEADAIYQTTLDQIATKETLLGQQAALTEAAREQLRLNRSQTQAAKSTNAEYERMQKRIADMNLAADPLARFNAGLKELQSLQEQGLSEAGYANELERLNAELAASVPMVVDVADAWGAFLAGGGRDFDGFRDRVLGSFRQMLEQMIATAARNKIMFSMGLGGSTAGGAVSAGAGLLGNMSGMGGALGALGTFGSSIGTGLSVVSGGFAAGGLGGAASASMGAISGGLSAGGAMGLGTALGAALPVIGAVALAVSFFKSKTKELDTGLRLTAKGANLTAESFRKIEKTRFWGLSKRESEQFKAVDSDPFQQAYDQIYGSISGLASSLNIGADAFSGFEYQVKVSLKGLDDAAREAAIAEEMTKFSDALAETALGAGATAAELETLVLGLKTSNAAFDRLGLDVYASSVSGARAAQNMLRNFESLEAFTQSASYYFENFYSDAERMDVATRDLSDVLSQLGFSTIPQTRAQFRMLVSGMRDAGLDDAVASLLKIAPLFVQIEEAMRNSVDTMVADAQAALTDAERAARAAYDAAVQAIDNQKTAILDEWQNLLSAAEDATRAAAGRLQRDVALITRVFDSAGDALSDLIDVASGRAQDSRSVVDKLMAAIVDRSSTGQSALQERARAVSTIQSGDRQGLDAALSTLARDSASLYADQASYLRSYARETAAIETLLAETTSQLSIEEATLDALNVQADSLSSIRDLIDEQVAIANGQLSTLEDAVAAIYGTGTRNARALFDLRATAEKGDTVAQDRLASVVQGVDLTSGVMEFVNAGIAALADAREQESITRAAADEQIASANAAASSQLGALNDSVKGILQLDDGILSVNDALFALDESIVALSQAQLSMSHAEQKQVELLRQQAETQTALMSQLLEAQRVGQIGMLQGQLEKIVKDLGPAPDVLRIVQEVYRGGNLLRDKASYVTLSDGQTFATKAGKGYEELVNAARMAQPSINASIAARNDWQRQFDAQVEPLRSQIRAMGGVPSFNGGGWTGNGARAGGVDGLGGFYAILHPEEHVFDTTKMLRPSISTPRTGGADIGAVVRELSALRSEFAHLRHENRQQQGKLVLNTTRLAQKARDDERIGALIRTVSATP